MISFLQMSLWGAVLTAVILAVRAVFGQRLPKRTFRVLWAVVILRMLVPLSLPIMKINTDMKSPALDTAFTRDAAAYTHMNGEVTASEYGGEVLYGTAYVVEESGGRDLPVREIWLITASAVFTAFAAAHIKFRLKVRDALPAEINFTPNLKRNVRVKVSDKINSPLTYGILRPVILLPKGVDKNSKAAGYILAHELTHIKRFDVLYKLLAVLAVSLHWFDPLAWVMLAAANRDLELSCDEEVILGSLGSIDMGNSREEYALTLIKMEEKRSFGVLSNGFGGSPVKERIISVMRLKKASPLGKAASVLLVALAFTVFTVYDIDNENFYTVTVSASEDAVEYSDPAEEGTYYTEYTIEAFDDPFTAEEIDRALNEYIAVEKAPLTMVEVADADVSESDVEVTYTEAVLYALDEEKISEYPEGYSLCKFGYGDAVTGKTLVVTIDLNEYSPIDCEKYGLTVSPEKGYYVYNGVPVAGFQCGEQQVIDDIAMKEGGGFFIYENGEMVKVNTAQFHDNNRYR